MINFLTEMLRLKNFENDVPLVMFDKETKTYIDCKNPNFEECDLLKVNNQEFLPNFNNFP